MAPIILRLHVRELACVLCIKSDDFLGSLEFQGWRNRRSAAVFSLTLNFSTGSAGLIQTIKAFSQPSLPAAIVGTVATVGWVVQGVGLAFYYRQVRAIAVNTTIIR